MSQTKNSACPSGGGRPEWTLYQLAPRLATLESKTIGLIDNRKRHSDVFLDHLQTLMRDK